MVSMKGLLFSWAMTLLGFGLHAQSAIIKEPEKVTEIMSTYRSTNLAEEEMQGWRIRLVATTERRIMEATREKFRREFPYMKSTWSHMNPYYQVQAGAFATKMEALPELNMVKEKFPKAYLIVDKISKEEISSNL
jgi:hypothetical protein